MKMKMKIKFILLDRKVAQMTLLTLRRFGQ